MITLILLFALLCSADSCRQEKKKSSKSRSSGPSQRARMYRMETGMHGSEWWD